MSVLWLVHNPEPKRQTHTHTNNHHVNPCEWRHSPSSTNCSLGLVLMLTASCSWRIFSKTGRLVCWKLAGPKEKCKPSKHSMTLEDLDAPSKPSHGRWTFKWTSQNLEPWPKEGYSIWVKTCGSFKFSWSSHWTMLRMTFWGVPAVPALTIWEKTHKRPDLFERFYNVLHLSCNSLYIDL